MKSTPSLSFWVSTFMHQEVRLLYCISLLIGSSLLSLKIWHLCELRIAKGLSALAKKLFIWKDSCHRQRLTSTDGLPQPGKF